MIYNPGTFEAPNPSYVRPSDLLASPISLLEYILCERGKRNC